jgi:PAS domain-containing protein
VNPAYERLTGYSRAEAIGRTPAELLRSDSHTAEFFEEIWNTMALVTDAGAVFPAGEVADWLRTAGFQVESTTSLVVAQGAYLVVARRI